MSSGGDMDREDREALREQRLKELLKALKPVGNAWVKVLSARQDPPTREEWALWRDLNKVLELIP